MSRSYKSFPLMALLVFGPLFASDANGTEYFVNGSCGNNSWAGTSSTCSSPDGPKATIQAGIDLASSGDIVTVADGTYSVLEADPEDSYGTRRLTFSGHLSSGAERNFTLRSANGPTNCIIDCAGSDENPCRVFDFNGESEYGSHQETRDAVVEGFTIKGGYVKSLGTHLFGGGFRIILASPTIRNCIIEENSAPNGGGVGMDGKNDGETVTSPLIEDCTIRENEARDDGAGIWALANADAEIMSTTIGPSNVAADDGGGVYWNGCDIQFTDCTISENEADNGGGIFARNTGTDEDPPFLKRCLIQRNEATTSAGGAGAWFEGPKEFWVVNTQFLGNVASASVVSH